MTPTLDRLSQRQREHYESRIDTLADECITLRARIADLESERDTYRELLQLSIGQLHSATNTIRQQRRTIADQREHSRRSLNSEISDARQHHGRAA